MLMPGTDLLDAAPDWANVQLAMPCMWPFTHLRFC